jgi:uncharacterized DUF497 family protein
LRPCVDSKVKPAKQGVPRTNEILLAHRCRIAGFSENTTRDRLPPHSSSGGLLTAVRGKALDKYYEKVFNLRMTRLIEFDPKKDAANWVKHKIRLATAALVFADPMRIERLDDSEGNMSEEERLQTLGRVGRVLFVVYTERGKKIRLISARLATKLEKRSYYGYDASNSKDWAKADQGTASGNS